MLYHPRNSEFQYHISSYEIVFMLSYEIVFYAIIWGHETIDYFFELKFELK
jgi:hypothetical protein